MKIALTVPSMSVPHGGIRIIIEWANRLSKNHGVILFCRKGVTPPSWMTISRKVKLTSNIRDMHFSNLLIICSPHDIDLIKTPGTPKRKIIFLQMLEHLFKPHDAAWGEKCDRTYASDLPLIALSQWNIDFIKKNYPNRGTVYHVGNGVNFKDFPIDSSCKKDGRTVLVEGWESSNPSKDTYGIGPKVAERLRAEGYRILAYSHLPLSRFVDVPHEYYLRPTIERLNDLYRRASILIKASRYDSRSCSPMEAMTKGCVTARAISIGDDDLVDDINCLRVDYNDEPGLYAAAKTLLTGRSLLARLRTNCLEYVQEHSWDYWMPQIEEILTNG